MSTPWEPLFFAESIRFDSAELDNVTMSLLSKNCLICMMETITQLQSLLSFFLC